MIWNIARHGKDSTYYESEIGNLYIGYWLPWLGCSMTYDEEGIGLMGGSGTIIRPDETVEIRLSRGERCCISRFGKELLHHSGELPGTCPPSYMGTSGQPANDVLKGVERKARAEIGMGVRSVTRY